MPYLRVDVTEFGGGGAELGRVIAQAAARSDQWSRGAVIAFTEYAVSGAGVVVKRALGR